MVPECCVCIQNRFPVGSVRVPYQRYWKRLRLTEQSKLVAYTVSKRKTARGRGERGRFGTDRLCSIYIGMEKETDNYEPYQWDGVGLCLTQQRKTLVRGARVRKCVRIGGEGGRL